MIILVNLIKLFVTLNLVRAAGAARGTSYQSIEHLIGAKKTLSKFYCANFMCFICILLGRFKIDLNVYLVGEPRSDQTNKYFHVSYLIENNEHILGMVA